MGIKDLNPFLEERCPACIDAIAYSDLREKRIAIDADNVLMKLMTRAYKQVVNHTDVCVRDPDHNAVIRIWLGHLKNEILKFLNYGITPIFVFDGKYIDEKSATQLKRREDRKKTLDAAEKLKAEMRLLDPLEITPQMVKKLREKMQNLGTVLSEDKELVKRLLKSLGIPVLIATGEGEKLCAMLCIEGKVDAVLSTDTDVIAMGCPILLTGEEVYVTSTKTGNRERGMKCTKFKPILKALNLEYSSFLDLCIMGGCDFNRNIPRIGIITAYDKHINIYKSIDNLTLDSEKISILNHIRCREIFKLEKSVDICQIIPFPSLNVNTDFTLYLFSQNNANPMEGDTKELVEVLEGYGVEVKDWIDSFRDAYKFLPQPSEICIPKYPSLAASRMKINVKSSPSCISSDSGNSNEKEEIQKEQEEKTPDTIETVLAAGVVGAPIFGAHASPEKMKPSDVKAIANHQYLKYMEKSKGIIPPIPLTSESSNPQTIPTKRVFKLNIKA